MRDLRNHPFVIALELGLIVTLVAVVMAHLMWQERLRVAPRAFDAPLAEGALLGDLEHAETIYVNAEMQQLGAVVVDELSGYRAMAVPEASPAHIFRLHPEDRRAEWERTPGPDFFLDDMQEEGAGHKRRISLATGGNEVVYVVDGNLWVHDQGALGLELVSADGRPVRVTFVVRGDIYVLDDLYAHDAGGAVAFLALPSAALFSGGGNIWLGDELYGTLAHVDGFFYAARDLHVVGLTAPAVVEGALAAGGAISESADERCVFGGLEVRFDDRLARDIVAPPGL